MKYRPQTTPMKHQQDYLRKLESRPDDVTDADVMAVLAEMGTGKSAMILYEWQNAVAADELDDLFVIAPAGSYRNWFEDKSDSQRSELVTHLDPRLYEKLTIGAWVTGGGVAARRQLEKTLTTNVGPRALFMNVEALSSVEEAENVAVDFLSRGACMLVVDESTRIKNEDAQRTKTIVRRLAPLAKARRIMTGWVTPKSPMDLFAQFQFLDWRILGYETMAGFRNRYANMEKRCFLPNEVIRAKLLSCMGIKNLESRLPDAHLRRKLAVAREHLGQDYSGVAKMPRETVIKKLDEEARIMRRDDMLELIPKLGGYIQVVNKVKSYKNLDELQKKIKPYSIGVLKKDCLDLKPKIYSPRDVSLTPQQRRMYEEIKKYAISEIGDGEFVSATSVITQMIRLHQIVCGHAVSEDGVITDVKSDRINEILEILEEHQGKAIIWATYQHEIRKIADALKKQYGPHSTAMFYGGNKNSRVLEEKKFLGAEECRFMVSTQSAGGLGNNWIVADLVIYAANSYDLELRVQSEDRAHRKGQAHPVTYVDLIARDTVEQKIIEALRKKIDLTVAITGENFREWLI